MTRPRALLFDVDGTLVDTEELHRQSFNQAFLRSGVSWDWNPALYAELLKVSGGHDRIARFIERLDISTNEKERFRRLIPQIHRMKTREYGARLEEGLVQPRPGVVRLIQEASAAGIRIGFASTSASGNVTSLLAAAFEPSARFEVGAIAHVDMVPRRKPAPDLYEHLMRMLRVSPEDSVAIEDSANGVAAARAAGVFVVATPTQWTRGQDFSAADLVLPDLGDPVAPLGAPDAARIGGERWLGLSTLSRLWTDARGRIAALHADTP